MFIDFRSPWTFFQKVDNLVKWLCQQDAHRNSVQKDVLFRLSCFFKVWFLKEFLDFVNPGQNVNLNDPGSPTTMPTRGPRSMELAYTRYAVQRTAKVRESHAYLKNTSDTTSILNPARPPSSGDGQDLIWHNLIYLLYLMECFKYAFNILVVSDGMYPWISEASKLS